MEEGKACCEQVTQVEPAAPVVSPDPPKIAIVGCSDSKTLAPYDDKSWEIWAMNNSYLHTRRNTKWFEIHPIKFEAGHFWRRKLIKPGIFEFSRDFRGKQVDEYMQDLARLDIPVYMQQHWDVIPKSIPYPLQLVTQKYGNYFTNSVSYMIVLAIEQILDWRGKSGKPGGEIGCYGVDMATGSEYGPQRPSCEFFLGIAAGLGIVLNIPPKADLLKTRFLYGFQEREQTQWEAKVTGIIEGMAIRKQKAIQQYEMSRKQIDQYVGAEEAVREIERIWSNLGDSKIWRDPQ